MLFLNQFYPIFHILIIQYYYTCIGSFIEHTYFPYSEEKEFFDLQKEQELSAQNISDSMPSSLMLLMMLNQN